MTRRHVTFDCQGETLVGTIDEAAGSTGLLIVSGGNEIRSGAFAGQARLASEIAAHGFPVFRFDRRGVGDSSGANRGYRHSADDIAAARDAFLAHSTGIKSVIALGNCDAASALMLVGGKGFAHLILSNPWTFDEGAEAMPTGDAIRARYGKKLRDPKELARLVRGKVNLSSLAKGIKAAITSAKASTQLAEELSEAVERENVARTFLVAGADRTGQAFLTNWPDTKCTPAICPGATHAYAEPESAEWLESRILEVLRLY